jgi:hypothetical protein
MSKEKKIIKKEIDYERGKKLLPFRSSACAT